MMLFSGYITVLVLFVCGEGIAESTMQENLDKVINNEDAVKPEKIPISLSDNIVQKILSESSVRDDSKNKTYIKRVLRSANSHRRDPFNAVHASYDYNLQATDGLLNEMYEHNSPKVPKKLPQQNLLQVMKEHYDYDFEDTDDIVRYSYQPRKPIQFHNLTTHELDGEDDKHELDYEYNKHELDDEDDKHELDYEYDKHELDDEDDIENEVVVFGGMKYSLKDDLRNRCKRRVTVSCKEACKSAHRNSVCKFKGCKPRMRMFFRRTCRRHCRFTFSQ